MIVLGSDAVIADWVSKRVGVRIGGPFTCIGVSRYEILIAGAVFHNWVPPSIEVSFAADDPRWCTRPNIRAILSYPFVQLECARLTAITRARNTRARTFLTKLGFVMEGYHPSTFFDDDAVSYGMLRESCKWIGPSHGQKLAIPSSSG